MSNANRIIICMRTVVLAISEAAYHTSATSASNVKGGVYWYRTGAYTIVLKSVTLLVCHTGVNKYDIDYYIVDN